MDDRANKEVKMQVTFLSVSEYKVLMKKRV